MLRFLLLVAALFVVTTWAQSKKCKFETCVRPSCYCRSEEMPIKAAGVTTKDHIPQFVMLTFDDAVSAVNMDFYRELLKDSRKNQGKCRIRATFFITHEYTNYPFVNELYLNGNEIASHSITHVSNTDEWRGKNQAGWKAEMVGLRKFAEKYGLIPTGKIRGTRAPFLQTSGDPLFQMMKSEGFLYDSSMPSRKYTDPPMWPYTLDYGYDQDCIIQPCPTETYTGIWEVPLVNLWKMRDVAGVIEEYPCSMADACLPFPETAAETKEYLISNFRRHHNTNKAPFPVFLHESWLKQAGRRQGYLDFVDEIMKLPDVYIVTIQEVIAYMRNPVNITTYKAQGCPKIDEGPVKCQARSCHFNKKADEWNDKRMDSCIRCPDEDSYPWVDNQ